VGKDVLPNRMRESGCGTDRDRSMWSAAVCGVIIGGVLLGTGGGSAGGSIGVALSIVDSATTSYDGFGGGEEERVKAVSGEAMRQPPADVCEPSVIPNHCPPHQSCPSKPSQIAHPAHPQICPDLPDKCASPGKVYGKDAPTGASIY
jgi:hypothetical protein